MSKDERFFLGHILDSIQLIEEYVSGVTKEGFIESQEKRDVVERRLEIIGEAVKNLPDSIRESYPDIPWRKIVALRNNLIHEYFSADPEIIWGIIENRLPKLKRGVSEILKGLEG